MAKCYVIMPYGGRDAEDHARFEGVYQSIIRNAARNAGIAEVDIIREDHKGDPGNIIHNVIHNIVEADVIIADLSEANANVHYELGIAHVFHKGATVLICQSGEKKVFDLQGLNVIEYSTEIMSIADSTAKITEAIKRRLEDKTITDNSVHETIDNLPRKLTTLLGDGDNELVTANQALSKENRRLKRILETSGIAESESQSVRTISEIFAEAKERMLYSGSSAMSHLKKLAEDEKWEEFMDFVCSVFEKGMPSKGDVVSTISAAQRADNQLLEQSLLEAGLILYPNDPDLNVRLARIYAKRPQTMAKAKQMTNTAIGLTIDEDGNFIGVDVGKLDHNTLARFLDTYLNMKAYDELVRAAEFLMDKVPGPEQDMLRRNMLVACTRDGKYEQASSYVPIVAQQNAANGWYIVAQYYDAIGNHAKELCAYEKAIACDPEDIDYFRIIVGSMLDENLARISPNGFEKVPRKRVKMSAAAFMYYSLIRHKADKQTISMWMDFSQKCHGQLVEYFEAAIPFLKGEEEMPPFQITDRTGLDYVLSMIEEE